MTVFLIIIGLLHAGFMIGELFPWAFPFALRGASQPLPEIHGGKKWTDGQQHLVATIVHNAGIYNGILAAGLIWAALAGEPARDVARVLLIGAAIAGVFGTVTLKSRLTALQAIVGAIGAVLVWRGH